MKRALKIIFILLLLAIIVMGGLWALSRKQAQKNGTTAPTFKDFFSRTVSVPQQTNQPNELGTVFVPPSDAPTTQTESSPAPETISLFTNTTISPTSTPPSTSATQSPITSIDLSVQGAGNSTPIIAPPAGEPSPASTPILATDNGPVCSTADSNIAFTPEELRRLNILQQRFNTIAPYLHTDGDLAIVEANYDSYKVKGEQLDALVGYYENTLKPKLPNTSFNKRVATPFWHDSGQDSQIFGVFFPVGTAVPYDFRVPSNYADEHSDDNDHRGVLEHALGIDIW